LDYKGTISQLAGTIHRRKISIMSIGGKNEGALGIRRAGVRVAVDGTSAAKGVPNTVTGVSKAAAVIVWHNDSKGNPEAALFFEINGSYYSTPDTVEWCRSLRPMSDWMLKGVASKVKEELRPEEIPETDAVDVLGNGDDDESTTSS
jgi:hypothetical protein